MPIPQEGSAAPEIVLETDSGQHFQLSSLKGQNVVLYFYPKDSTPGCTQEACDFQAALPKLKKKDVIVLGVSKDSIASHQKFKQKQGLRFPLLSDPEGKVCESYGVWQEKSLYGRKFMGIVRTTVLIGPKGEVRKIFPKVKVNGHVAEILEVLD